MGGHHARSRAGAARLLRRSNSEVFHVQGPQEADEALTFEVIPVDAQIGAPNEPTVLLAVVKIEQLPVSARHGLWLRSDLSDKVGGCLCVAFCSERRGTSR